MFVYQFIGPVATAFFAVGYYQVWERRAVVRPLILGVVAYLPTWITLLIVGALRDASLYGAGLFLDVLVTEHVVPIFAALALFYIAAGRVRSAPQAPFLVGMSSFFGGFFAVEALLFVALGPDLVTAYDLFVLPTLRVLAVLVIPLIVWALRRAGGLDRYIWVLVAIVTLGLFSLISFLEGLNYHVPAYAITGVMVAAVIALHLFIAGNRAG
jgi:hypothetical protein